ncbi:MAG: GcrA family cell cycle regulator [Proteobacteria bacterium]|nr:GcrA family cell cycle regulator [Pseudomonadota bacterium]
MSENNWTQATLKKLKSMADRGMSTAEIGKRLGMTKNAIVGKLNRMGWNAKSKSADVKKSAPAPKQPKPAARAEKRPAASAAKKQGAKQEEPKKTLKKPPVRKFAPTPAARDPRSRAGTAPIAPGHDKKDRLTSKKSLAAHQRIIQHSLDLANLRADQCRWPIGDPDSERFHFCGKQVFVNKPYCYDHCLQAYQFTQPKKKN